MSTRDIIAVSGAAIGAAIGGPYGAQIGFTIGYTVGSYVDPIKLPHPGLNDAPIQTSRDGIPIVLIHGLQYCHGNIIQKNPEVVVTTYERQGKGGGTKVETKTRFRTFAIGICEGPISGLTRIWENNRLVYDSRSSPAIPAEETTKYAEGFTLYLGGEAQLPDPELEAHWGTDETPAYRGLAYIVFNDKDLTDVGGSIPQFAFEVNGSVDASITSKPYPVEAVDGIIGTPSLLEGFHYTVPIEGAAPAVGLLDGTLQTLVQEYTYETEGLDQTVAMLDGTIEVKVQSYTYETEGVDTSVAMLDGTLEVKVIFYDYDDEGIDPSVGLLDGTLI